jgi:hypothetical protein
MVEKSYPTSSLSVLKKPQTFTFEFEKYEDSEKHTEFFISVKALMRSLEGIQSLAILIKDRYSGLLDFQKMYRASLGGI